jgi:hypothetical protein
MRLAPRLAEARHSDKEKTYCGFIARLTPHLSEWILISLGIIRLLISGSQVRALVRPPSSLAKPVAWGLPAGRPLLRPFLAIYSSRF